jgi:beta-lactamase class D
MALETGVAKDADFMLKWDSIPRWSSIWSQDHTLKMAFQNSTVWYYQELARRMGAEKMKVLLNKMNYGNMDTSGGVDLYWLTGGLRISPMQEIDFLRRLHTHQLPVSARSMNICEQIMLADSNQEYTLRAKTGWSATKDPEIAWYVGYFETKDNVYYFANCVFPNEKSTKKLFSDRKEIVYKVFKSLGFIQP